MPGALQKIQKISISVKKRISTSFQNFKITLFQFRFKFMPNSADVDVAGVPDQFEINLFSSNGIESPIIMSASNTSTNHMMSVSSPSSSSTKMPTTRRSYSSSAQGSSKSFSFTSTDIRQKYHSTKHQTMVNDVSVTHIVSPQRFYVQHKAIGCVNDSLLNMCIKESLDAAKVDPIDLNTMYLVHVAQQNGWFRGIVRNVLAPDVYEVFYVDYGNQEEVQSHRYTKSG